jgi:hypothetical protein
MINQLKSKYAGWWKPLIQTRSMEELDMIAHSNTFKRSLGAWSLTSINVGAIIGTGIFGMFTFRICLSLFYLFLFYLFLLLFFKLCFLFLLLWIISFHFFHKPKKKF